MLSRVVAVAVVGARAANLARTVEKATAGLLLGCWRRVYVLDVVDHGQVAGEGASGKWTLHQG